MELARNPVPLIVSTCAAAPTVTEDGKRLDIVGIALRGVTVEVDLLPPPPQPIMNDKPTMIQATTRYFQLGVMNHLANDYS